jgi:cation diffusion facilitator family transporter
MTGCDCRGETETKAQRKALGIALVLNAVMFLVELVGGILGQSSGLIADSLDMLADASAYAIALAAIGRSPRFKAGAAGLSGTLLLALGLGVLFDVGRRALFGSTPDGGLILGVAAVALAVNTVVLRLLLRHRDGEVHLRAAWIFTRADVLANLGVMAGAVLVMVTGSRVPDLVVGLGIGLFVMREAREILGEAREARPSRVVGSSP